MLVVSCTKCDGWIVVVADESDRSCATPFLEWAKEEARKPDRKVTITKDVYDERSFGLTGACSSSYGRERKCGSGAKP